MSFGKSEIIHNKIDGMLIASIRFSLRKREELNPKFEKLSQQCKDYICGPAIAIYDYGVYTKRKHCCHCPLVRNHLGEGISPTFCYCGSGWYRQQWEGILGKPVKVEILKSLLKGDDICQFAIHLPLDSAKSK